MTGYSTNEAAVKLGISGKALSRYIQLGKVPAPRIVHTGKASLHVWSDEEIERVRELLPKIANGRKTRYQKLREKKRAQPKAAALPKKRRTKKKK